MTWVFRKRKEQKTPGLGTNTELITCLGLRWLRNHCHFAYQLNPFLYFCLDHKDKHRYLFRRISLYFALRRCKKKKSLHKQSSDRTKKSRGRNAVSDQRCIRLSCFGERQKRGLSVCYSTATNLCGFSTHFKFSVVRHDARQDACNTACCRNLWKRAYRYK